MQVGYGSFQLAGAVTMSPSGLPSFVPPPEVADAGVLAMASPAWAAAGLGMSLVFLFMAKLNAASVVGRCELALNSKPSAGPLLRVQCYDMFGGLEERGEVLRSWNAATGGGVKSFNEARGMITFLPNGDDAVTFHKIIDTDKGRVVDRRALVEALARSAPPSEASAGTAPADPQEPGTTQAVRAARAASLKKRRR